MDRREFVGAGVASIMGRCGNWAMVRPVEPPPQPIRSWFYRVMVSKDTGYVCPGTPRAYADFVAGRLCDESEPWSDQTGRDIKKFSCHNWVGPDEMLAAAVLVYERHLLAELPIVLRNPRLSLDAAAANIQQNTCGIFCRKDAAIVISSGAVLGPLLGCGYPVFTSNILQPHHAFMVVRHGHEGVYTEKEQPRFAASVIVAATADGRRAPCFTNQAGTVALLIR